VFNRFRQLFRSVCGPLGLALLGGVAAGPARARAEVTDVRRDLTVAVIEKVMPCVVNIGTETMVESTDPFDQFRRNFFGYQSAKQPRYSIGSGVVIDEDGFVLTNEHVVHGATRVWVKFQDGREYEAAEKVWTSKSDVAVLHLRTKPGEKFPAVKFAADDDLLLGETVIALGNPFGLGGSVSRGILSSKNRRPPEEGEPLYVADCLQTDAAINPGNSGGPLINLRGELIGMNVAYKPEGHGIGFAIPIKRISEALSEILTPEILKQLWFGARVRADQQGLTVVSVQSDSPAAQAGLRVGDAITGMGGRPTRNLIEFSRKLSVAGEEQPVQLDVQRDGKSRTIAVKLIPEKAFFNADLVRKILGATLEELAPPVAERLRRAGNNGLIIKSVDEDGPADKAQLTPGMLIRGINGQATEQMVDAAKILYGKKHGEKVVLDVLVEIRRGVNIFQQTGTVEVAVR